MNGKRFRVINNVGVIDDLTGEIYGSHLKLCTLLNQINDRANHNAEQCDEIARILIKYGIKDLRKLDQILFEQRVW